MGTPGGPGTAARRRGASRCACRAAGGGGVEALTLPRSDVLRYSFAGGSWLAIRPSGTEPKLKLYLGAQAPNEEGCATQIQRLNQLSEKITALAD
ncbi:MAG: hypothetical protein K6T68_12790 [Alicyclobacillus shizuokensis]|nr:hypothetical protein [Alicyclobacillus shizuokensis]